MKIFFILILLSIAISLRGQNIQQIDKHLTSAFDKIEYWNEYDETNGNISKYDSLKVALKIFEQQLLHITQTVPQTLDAPFKGLTKKGVTIATSEDGLFRIYSWYLYNGGTMHFYKNIFQYKNQNGIHAFISDTTRANDVMDPGCFYRQVNKIISQQKTFYITQSISVLSSAYTAHFIKIFSIEDYGLNDTAQLIKTKTGIGI